MIGLRTTKNCKDSKVIKSLQIIYLSNDKEMCNKYLHPVSNVLTTKKDCPLDEYEFSAQHVMNITGWSKNLLESHMNELGAPSEQLDYY